MSVRTATTTLHRRSQRRTSALAVVACAALLASACTRSSDEVETGTPVTAASNATTSTSKGSPAAGDFGDLKGVCGPGDASGATAQGVTNDAIQIGTIADPGFVGRSGLNQEVFDATEVFTTWCNKAGGINGRKIKLVERDAKLTEYKQRVTEACQEDFMLVGSGGVFDGTGQAERLGCLLPEIPAFQVTPEARDSDLAVRPLPTAVNELPVNTLQYLEKNFPGSTDQVGFVTGNLASLVFVDAQLQEGASALGWTTAYQAQYNTLGEPSWTPLAQALKSAKVRGLVYTGEPENLAKLLQAMVDIDYQPDWVLGGANVIDQRFIDIGGKAINNVYATTAVVPAFLADKNPATQQYLDLFEQYLPDGKSKALLGYNSFSAWLLFATAAGECGSDVTRKCVFEAAQNITKWTGGGLHAESNPGKSKYPRCSMVIEATPDGFVIPDKFEATDGLFTCSDDSVLTLKKNYGTGATLESVGKSIDDLE
ncbi:MAG: ABC transporter substrate-binding protein [Aquihabitans sp.]